MRKIIKTIILLPIFPLIWISGAKSAKDPLYQWERGSCYGNGLWLLKWRER